MDMTTVKYSWKERLKTGNLTVLSHIKDPNIDLMFAGTIDLEEQTPSFIFTMDVANLRPYYLNLRDDDPEYFASFLINTNMSGKRIDELNGSVELVNSLFRRSGGQVQLYDMMLKTKNSPDSSFISLHSDALNAKYQVNITCKNYLHCSRVLSMIILRFFQAFMLCAILQRLFLCRLKSMILSK